MPQQPLVDSAGQVRAVVEEMPNGCLVVYALDKYGRTLGQLLLKPDGSAGIQLDDDFGVRRLLLWCEYGRTCCTFHDARGVPIYSLIAAEGQGPRPLNFLAPSEKES